MNKTLITIKKYLKINLILLFVLGTSSFLYLQNNNNNNNNLFTNSLRKKRESTNNNEPLFINFIGSKNKPELINLLKKHYLKYNFKNKLKYFFANFHKKYLSNDSSIQFLGNNKYLLGTYNEGFYLLEFNDENNLFIVSKIKDENNVEILELTNNFVSKGARIQSLGNNKYLLGSFNNGFYLLEFNNENNSFIVSKIKDKNNEVISILTSGDVSNYSSIQFLENNKYLVGTGNQGFYLLEFNNENNSFTTSKIKGSNENNEEISDLTSNNYVGQYSLIQSLGNNKYLVGTFDKGFYLLEFYNENNTFWTSKIKNLYNQKTSDLVSAQIGRGCSIEFLGNDKYLVGTYNKGFYLFEFNNINNKFITSKIKDENNEVIFDLSIGNVANYSSIKFLGNDKYLIGTENKGFYLLEFNDENDSFTASKIRSDDNISNLKSGKVGHGSFIKKLKNNLYFISTYNDGFYLLEFLDNDKFEVKNIIKNEFYIKNIFIQKTLNKILSFSSSKEILWDTFYRLFDKNLNIKDDANFHKISKIKLIKLIKLIILFGFIENFNKSIDYKKHKKIIKLVKFLNLNVFDFKNLLGIIDGNPLTNESFNKNGEILDIFFYNFGQRNYDIIKKWLNTTDKFSDELIDKENQVIEKIKKKLANDFNTFELNLDIRKKIAKLITEIKEIPIYFFSDTGLTKESFELSEEKTYQMKINVSWNINLETSIEILNNYKSWIESLNEEKYKELLIYRINELLTNDIKELIFYAKESIGKEDEILEIIEIDFSHTDFKNDGSLTDNLTIEKLEIIQNWMNNFNNEKTKNILKKIIKEKISEIQKKIIKSVKWLKENELIDNINNENSFKNLLGIIENNPFYSDSFTDDGNFKNEIIENFEIYQFYIIKKWLDISDESLDELIDKEIQVIQKINEKISEHFNKDETRKNIIKILKEISTLSYNFFMDTQLKLENFNINGEMKSNVILNINLIQTIEHFDNYNNWIDSLNEEKYKELLEHKINEILTDDKKIKILVIKNELNRDEILGFYDEYSIISHTYFDFNGSLNENLTKEILETIKIWLIDYFDNNKIWKKILKNKLNDQHKNIIRLIKLSDLESDYNNLLGTTALNPFTIEWFNNENKIIDSKLDTITFSEYFVIWKWLDKTILENELVDREYLVIQKIKEKLTNYFNTSETNLDIRKKIAKLIIEIDIVSYNFFRNTGLSKNSFESINDETGQMRINASWNVNLTVEKDILDEYISWIDSLNEVKMNNFWTSFWNLIQRLLIKNYNENKNYIQLIKKRNFNEKENIDEILGFNLIDEITHTDFNHDGSLKKFIYNLSKLIKIKYWLKNLDLRNINIRKELIQEFFLNYHKNIIRLTKLLNLNELDFKNLLKISKENPLTNKSFYENGNILDVVLDDLIEDQHYFIIQWLKNTEENENELIDKKDLVIKKINDILVNHFNIFETNLDIRKKIAKLIIETNEVSIDFFSNTGLTKESFEISEYGIGQMKIQSFWKIKLNTTKNTLINYKSWIDSLNEEKYKELLIYRINELLTSDKKEFILDTKKIHDHEDEILGLDEIDGVSHTDFNDNSSLNDNLTTEKLEKIKDWLINFEIYIEKNKFENLKLKIEQNKNKKQGYGEFSNIELETQRNNNEALHGRISDKELETQQLKNQILHGRISNKELENQQLKNNDLDHGWISDKELETQRSNNDTSYGRISDEELENQQLKNNGLNHGWISDKELETQRSNNQDLHGRISNEELNVQEINNDTSGFGSFSDKEIKTQNNNNKASGHGIISNKELETQRSDNEALHGRISNEELNVQQINNDTSDFGSFSDKELETQRKNNQEKGFGSFSDKKLEVQKSYNQDLHGRISNEELNVQQTNNETLGHGSISYKELNVQLINNNTLGFGRISNAELETQRSNNEVLHGRISNEELNVQQTNNETLGHGSISYKELNVQQTNNYTSGFGSFSNVELETQRNNNQDLHGWISNTELKRQQTKNDDSRHGSISDKELETQRKNNQEKGFGSFSDKKLEVQRKKNEILHGRISNEELNVQQTNNYTSGYRRISDTQLETQRSHNETSHGRISNVELERQQIINHDLGHGRISDKELETQRKNNQEKDLGSFSDKKLEIQKNNNEILHGRISDIELKRQQIINDDSGHGRISNKELNVQQTKNETLGHGRTSNKELKTQRSNNEALYGSFSNEEIKRQQIINRDLGHGIISDKELNVQQIYNYTLGFGKVSNEELETQRSHNQDLHGRITNAELKSQRNNNEALDGSFSNEEIKIQKIINHDWGYGRISNLQLEIQRSDNETLYGRISDVELEIERNNNEELGYERFSDKELETQRNNNEALHGKISDVELERQQIINRGLGHGRISNAELETQRKNNELLHGRISDKKLKTQRKNNELLHERISDVELETQRNNNEALHGKISNKELNLQQTNNETLGHGRISNVELNLEQTNNETLGHGRISNVELETQRSNNKEKGSGSFSDKKLKIQRKNNELLHGRISDKKLETQRNNNEELGYERFSDKELETQRNNNEALHGRISDVELEIERNNNEALHGKISNKELNLQQNNNETLGHGKISNKELNLQQNNNETLGHGRISNVELETQRSNNKEKSSGSFSDKKLKIQRKNNELLHGRISDKKLETQRNNNEELGYERFSDKELETQRNNNEALHGRISDKELKVQQTNNEALHGRISNLQLEIQRSDNETLYGRISDVELEIERNNNEELGYERFSDKELETQRNNNEALHGRISNQELNLQQTKNKGLGYGNISDVELETQKNNNEALHGRISDAELEIKRNNNEELGYERFSDKELEIKKIKILNNEIIILLNKNNLKFKNLISDVKKNPETANEKLEITTLDFSHTDFKDDGSLKKNLSKEKLIVIKKWLITLQEKRNYLIIYILIPVILVIFLIIIYYFVFKIIKSKKNKKIITLNLK